MKFSIYGRFQVEVRRENGAWIAYRSQSGMRAPLDDIVLPSDLAESDLATYLDDIFHELAGIGQNVERLPD